MNEDEGWTMNEGLGLLDENVDESEKWEDDE